MLQKITQACRYLLQNYSGADATREYLNNRVSLESQEIFQFGYYPGINELSLLTDVVSEAGLRKLKLIYYRDIEDLMCPRTFGVCFFENHPMVIPFRDAYGNVVALVGRTLLSEDDRKIKKIDKYKNTHFKKGNYLFGLYENKQHILSQNRVLVVEGQFDVIKAMEKGIRNIVAIGNNTMSAYQFSVITRYTNNINLLLDNDDAGDKGRKSTISKFGSMANIQNFYIPDGYKDIDEYLTKSDESPSFVYKG